MKMILFIKACIDAAVALNFLFAKEYAKGLLFVGYVMIDGVSMFL